MSSLEERVTSEKMKFSQELEERDLRRKEDCARKEKIAEDKIAECEEKMRRWEEEKSKLEEETRELRRILREEKVKNEREVESLKKNHKFEIDVCLIYFLIQGCQNLWLA